MAWKSSSSSSFVFFSAKKHSKWVSIAHPRIQMMILSIFIFILSSFMSHLVHSNERWRCKRMMKNKENWFLTLKFYFWMQWLSRNYFEKILHFFTWERNLLICKIHDEISSYFSFSAANKTKTERRKKFTFYKSMKKVFGLFMGNGISPIENELIFANDGTYIIVCLP